ncbi:MAG: alpha/beta fold hydrolase [Pseudomonadota bacterium]
MKKASEGNTRWRVAQAFLAALAIAISLWTLFSARSVLSFTEYQVGTTPVTVVQSMGESGPPVIIAHGFAGSRQFMDSFSLSLARAGLTVVTFDFQGHGRNPVPMSGDVTQSNGTTARLVAETRAVADWAEARYGGPLSFVGHSMASDVIIRTAETVEAAAIIPLAMYSEAITPTAPERLLIINGEWEPHLRRAALDALHQIDPAAGEGDTVTAGPVIRRAIVAPWVGHVGVLHHPLSLTEARDWIAAALERPLTRPVVSTGLPVLILLGGVLLLARPLSFLIPATAPEPFRIDRARFALATALPALATPLLVSLVPAGLGPVLAAVPLAAFFTIYGTVQLIVLGTLGLRLPAPPVLPTLALILYGVFGFALAMDMFAASFWPVHGRVWLVLMFLPGALLFMSADAAVTEAGRDGLGRRVLARLAIIAAFAGMVAMDVEQLFVLSMMLPVLVLFFAVFGLMGRWVARRSGAAGAGVGLGVLLAWSFGSALPIFDQNTTGSFRDLAAVAQPTGNAIP